MRPQQQEALDCPKRFGSLADDFTHLRNRTTANTNQEHLRRGTAQQRPLAGKGEVGQGRGWGTPADGLPRARPTAGEPRARNNGARERHTRNWEAQIKGDCLEHHAPESRARARHIPTCTDGNTSETHKGGERAATLRRGLLRNLNVPGGQPFNNHQLPWRGTDNAQATPHRFGAKFLACVGARRSGAGSGPGASERSERQGGGTGARLPTVGVAIRRLWLGLHNGPVQQPLPRGSESERAAEPRSLPFMRT